MTRAYDPYGNTILDVGIGETSYGYTGEYTDSTGQIYLRARMYNPAVGRFISRDTWAGDDNMPMSYNAWLYGYGNPVRYTEPSMFHPIEKQDFEKIYVVKKIVAGYLIKGITELL